MRLFGREWRKDELMRRVGRIGQIGGVRLLELQEGRERGVRILEFRAGSGLEFDLLIDRAMDIGRCEYTGIPLAWLSHTGFASPYYYEPGGVGWLRSFGGGLLSTCGLDHAFFPAEDTVEFYHSPREKESYGLHGRIGSTPASRLWYGESWDGDECLVWAEGEVRQAMVYGENLVLRRRIEVRLGERRIRLRDVVSNEGFDETPHMLVYHINLGFPLIDEGTEILAPFSGVKMRLAGARDAGEDYRRIDPPMKGFLEQVWAHEMVPDGQGMVRVMVVNRRLMGGDGLAFYLIYRKRELPEFVEWRMLGEGTYVLGIEPSTNMPEPRAEAREAGRLRFLGPGECVSYHLEMGVLTGDEIGEFEMLIR